jgi:hypothetical protein
MTKYSLLLAIFAAVILIGPRSALAEDTSATLMYDDGGAERWISDAEAGAVESTMFFIPHPAYLESFRIYFSGTGPVEVHVWADGGGNDPDLSRDLIAPRQVTITNETALTWTEFELGDTALDLQPLRYVHIGIIRQDKGAGMAIDDSSPAKWSFYYPADDPTVKYSLGETGNFMVRAEVIYHDINQNQSFVHNYQWPGITRAALGDYDDDGDDDVLVNAGELLRNNGDGTFSDISEDAGIAGLSGYGIWADYDNDGHLDYYAFSHGTDAATRDRLVHNNGDGTFSPVTDEDGVPWDLDPTEAAAWADYDNDGWVDLYVANYETETGVGTKDHLWKNLGEGRFRNVSDEVGLLDKEYCGRGVAWGDFNNDGCIDLYVANYRLDPNQLYQNNCDGTFKDVAYIKHVAGENVRGSYGHSIGASWGDYNNDGYLDLVVGNLAHPRFIDFSDKTMLYLNQGPPSWNFVDQRETAGITYSETHSDTLFFDYDNDGWLDLLITVIYGEYASFLYHNAQNETFTDSSYETGLWMYNSWGAVAGDLDRDGDLDVLARSPFSNLLVNAQRTPPNSWLQVRLKGHKTNTAGIGCRITVEAGGLTQIREVEGGKGTGVQSSLTQHFGLGSAASVDRVSVRWVDGTVTELTDVVVNQRLVIEEQAMPECQNQLGECLSDTRIKHCVNWEWVEEDCPDGWLCEDRFCYNPNPEDGDIDEDLEKDIEEEEPPQDGDLDDEQELDTEQEPQIDGDEKELPEGHYLLTPSGGRIVTPEGLVLVAPPLAVDEDLIIQIRVIGLDDSDGMTLASPVFRFLPHDQHFSKALTVSIPYDTALAEDKTLTYYWSRGGEESMVDPHPEAVFKDGLASASIYHFCLGFVAFDTSPIEDDQFIDGPQESGFGCQSAPSAPPAWLLALVVAALLRRGSTDAESIRKNTL